jgi:glycosyltransferase involved in cell wall biosynthesis
LLRGLIARANGIRFELLTAAHNHDEFSAFEQPGVSRRNVGTVTMPLGLRRQQFDLLFCPMTAPTFAEHGVATVCTLYDLQHLAYPWFFSNAEVRHRNHFYRELIARADHVVCISEFSRRCLIEQLGMAPALTTAVPISIHHRLEPRSPEHAWRGLSARGLRPCRFALYPANFWPHKNHRMLLVAFGRFLAEHAASDLHLVLTGELLGNGESLLDGLSRMGLGDRVHALGYVSDDEMAALWSVADLLVFPSLYEGFGIPVLEALHFGKPVLCSREGSLPEVGRDDVTYFDARNPRSLVDALAFFEANGPLLRDRAVQAQTRRASADPMMAVDAYLSIFDRTVAERRRHGRSRADVAYQFLRTWSKEALFDRRRARGSALLRSGRVALHHEAPVSGAGRVMAGLLIAPDVAAEAALKPVLARATRAVVRAGGHPALRRWMISDATKKWLSHHALHDDGWAGPTLIVDIDVEPQHTQIVLEASGPPGGLYRPLVLRATLGRVSLGRRVVGRVERFEACWRIPSASPGRHTLRIVANAFVVAGNVARNSDPRPLSYRVVRIAASGEPIA